MASPSIYVAAAIGHDLVGESVCVSVCVCEYLIYVWSVCVCVYVCVYVRIVCVFVYEYIMCELCVCVRACYKGVTEVKIQSWCVVSMDVAQGI